MAVSDTERRERFDAWVAEMDNKLERFFSSLPDETRAKLDFSPASLDALEGWLLGRYANPVEIRQPPEIPNLDGASRYVGQTLIKGIGGHWELSLRDPTNVFYGLPIVTGYSERPTPECPHRLVTTSLSRRTGDFIRSVVDAMIKRHGKK
jgi:hypothetical protein